MPSGIVVQEGSASKVYCSPGGNWQYIAQNYQALDVIVSPSVFTRCLAAHAAKFAH